MLWMIGLRRIRTQPKTGLISLDAVSPENATSDWKSTGTVVSWFGLRPLEKQRVRVLTCKKDSG